MLDDSQRAAALGRLRVLSGLSQRAAARRIGIRLSTLRAWESRQLSPNSEQLSQALAVYGRDLDRLLTSGDDLVSPDRPGVLVVGDREIDTASIRSDYTDPAAFNDRVLREYLSAVRSARGTSPTGAVELRSVDISQLALHLDLSDVQLTKLLQAQLNLTPAGAQLATRAVLVAGLIGLVAFSGVGTSWLRGTQANQTATGEATTALVPYATDSAPNTSTAMVLARAESESADVVFSTESADRHTDDNDLFSSTPRGTPERFLDHSDFGSSPDGRSFSIWPRTSDSPPFQH